MIYLNILRVGYISTFNIIKVFYEPSTKSIRPIKKFFELKNLLHTDPISAMVLAIFFLHNCGQMNVALEGLTKIVRNVGCAYIL